MKILFFTIFISIFPAISFAQGSHVGGGDATASDIQYIMNQLDAYLLTNEGKAEFPEIQQPEFHYMVKKVRPVVKDERVYDGFGINQTCISVISELQRLILCDLRRLPQFELNNWPTFYRLIFHELLFQVGLETPISSSIPSDFRISSRLKLHLSNSKEWLPGDGFSKISEDCVTLSQYEVLRTSVIKNAIIDTIRIKHDAFLYRKKELEARATKKIQQINKLANDLALQACLIINQEI
jgi:hypothetical protein